MTEPGSVPAPAEQAVGSGQSALADDQVAPTHVRPPATQDNYSQIARDQAAVRGIDPGDVLREMADQWDQLHERQPLDGYDHLAAWARQADPTAGGGPSGLTVLQARALESARRDPYQAVIGDQGFVREGIAAQQVQDAQVAAATAAPSVDPASGMLPGTGPLPVPSDVQAAGDPAVVEQQQAAAEQRDEDGSAGNTTPPPPAPATDTSTSPAPATPTPTGKSGKGNGGAGTSSSGDSTSG
jgi:hypothetical protein